MFHYHLALSKPCVLIILLALIFPNANTWAATIDRSEVQVFISPTVNVEALKEIGQDVLPVLARLYESSNEDQRIKIAHAFYQLGWKSEEAKRVLMRDVHTDNRTLRISVQYALGRVSNNEDVVEVLLNNMQNDLNPLFRDKAACALAYDQIHLTEEQKVRLYEGLIHALTDPKPQVRRIAIKALKIHTGQTKGFNPNAPVNDREAKIGEWGRWLEEYRSGL